MEFDDRAALSQPSYAAVFTCCRFLLSHVYQTFEPATLFRLVPCFLQRRLPLRLDASHVDIIGT